MTGISNKTTRKPNPKAFTKGKSGNPIGRPKKTEQELDLIQACKDKTPDALAVIVDIMSNGEKEATRLQAAQSIIERAYGKPVQPTDTNHSGSVSFGWME